MPNIESMPALGLYSSCPNCLFWTTFPVELNVDVLFLPNRGKAEKGPSEMMAPKCLVGLISVMIYT